MQWLRYTPGILLFCLLLRAVSGALPDSRVEATPLTPRQRPSLQFVINTNTDQSSSSVQAKHDEVLLRFLLALGDVESGNHDGQVGDAGAALGRFQIHRLYFDDAQKTDPALRNCRYRDVFNPYTSVRVVVACWLRYEPAALARLDFETLARFHNGGPAWREKPRATDRYWQRIEIAMDKFGVVYESKKEATRSHLD